MGGRRTQNRWHVIYLFLVLALLMGCTGGVERPFGVLRIGVLKSIPLGKIRYFEEYSLLVQRDSGGIRAMSTLSPASFIPLDKTIIDDHVLFRDSSNGALFDESGRLQSLKLANQSKEAGAFVGGIQRTLTHYRVIFDRGAGELEILVVVGDARPPDWRLKVPA
jgi:hypothetical protein